MMYSYVGMSGQETWPARTGDFLDHAFRRFMSHAIIMYRASEQISRFRSTMKSMLFEVK